MKTDSGQRTPLPGGRQVAFRRAVTRQPDGSLELREGARVMRSALLIGAVAVPWAVASSIPSESQPDTLRVVLGLIAGAFFLVAALLVESRRYYFDTKCRIIRWSRWRLTGSRSGELPFSAVTAVVAQPRMEDDNSATRRLTYRPVMLTTEGELPLSNSTSLDASDFAGLMSTIREALGLRVMDAGDPTFGLVRAGQLIEAVTLLRNRDGMSLDEARRRVADVRWEIDRAQDRDQAPGTRESDAH